MDCSCCFAFRVSKRSRPRGGRRLDQSGRLILNLGDLGLVLVDLDLDLGVQVARGGDEEVEGTWMRWPPWFSTTRSRALSRSSLAGAKGGSSRG